MLYFKIFSCFRITMCAIFCLGQIFQLPFDIFSSNVFFSNCTQEFIISVEAIFEYFQSHNSRKKVPAEKNSYSVLIKIMHLIKRFCSNLRNKFILDQKACIMAILYFIRKEVFRCKIFIFRF